MGPQAGFFVSIAPTLLLIPFPSVFLNIKPINGIVTQCKIKWACEIESQLRFRLLWDDFEGLISPPILRILRLSHCRIVPPKESLTAQTRKRRLVVVVRWWRTGSGQSPREFSLILGALGWNVFVVNQLCKLIYPSKRENKKISHNRVGDFANTSFSSSVLVQCIRCCNIIYWCVGQEMVPTRQSIPCRLH